MTVKLINLKKILRITKNIMILMKLTKSLTPVFFKKLRNLRVDGGKIASHIVFQNLSEPLAIFVLIFVNALSPCSRSQIFRFPRWRFRVTPALGSCHLGWKPLLHTVYRLYLSIYYVFIIIIIPIMLIDRQVFSWNR